LCVVARVLAGELVARKTQNGQTLAAIFLVQFFQPGCVGSALVDARASLPGGL
jgi:hypothetical protein